MGTLHDRIRQARKHARFTQAELASRVGVVQAAVASWERPGGNETDLERLRKIAHVTGVQEQWLTTGKGEMFLDFAPANGTQPIENTTHRDSRSTKETARDIESKPLHHNQADDVRPGVKNLPILGHGMGGDEGFFMDQGKVHGYTERPGILEGVAEAYAVRVHDQSMTPALKHGFLVWVDPHRPAAPGDDVVIQLADGQAFIKTLVRRTQKIIRCKQYNPEKEIDFPSGGTTIHLIVGSTRIRD